MTKGHGLFLVSHCEHKERFRMIKYMEMCMKLFGMQHQMQYMYKMMQQLNVAHFSL